MGVRRTLPLPSYATYSVEWEVNAFLINLLPFYQEKKKNDVLKICKML